jgi:UDP-glucose 4-epimerase
MVLGYDPLFQVMHEEDAAQAMLVAAVAAVDEGLKGVFNVAGPQPLPLSAVVRLAGRAAVHLPEPLFPWAFGRFGLPRLAAQSLEHIKHPVVVDDGAFRRATGFAHQWDETETLSSFRYA